MKTRKIIYLKITLILGLITNLTLSCDRDLSEDAQLATYPKTAEVFIDGFSAGLGYGAFGNSLYTGFNVDTDVSYKGSASMRFDVPNVGDPEGAYVGGVFIDGGGRDLSGYDALTFWAKGSQSATINELGFGNDFNQNKYLVSLTNVPISTYWKKYIIPIPDASKLKSEKGMFWYAEGPENGQGYTFWIDEVKYEKLGTIAHPIPKIFNGINKVEDSFIGLNSTITGLTQTFNLGSGINQTVSAAPSYFIFKSSNTNVATVDELGVISVVGTGTTVITAKLGDIDAIGSYTINSLGVFTSAPTPPARTTANVKSIFSNAYANVAVDYFNGYWNGSTTQTTDFSIATDDFKSYTQLNYVGVEFSNPTVNASTLTHLHLDILPRLITNNNFQIKIRDRGANGVINSDNNGNATQDDKEISYSIPGNNFTLGVWSSVDIPLTGNLTNQKNNLALIVFIGNINFVLDNLYFYKN